MRVCRSSRRKCHERGQAAMGALLWIGFAVLVLLGVGRLGEAAVDAARAASAADAAALAGAAHSDAAATDVARQNGATIVSIERDGNEFQVRVRVGGAVADARAELLELRP
ncbi:MAG: pilus assembly protein TadG-related protein [Acidimicrobiales bacterium]